MNKKKLGMSLPVKNERIQLRVSEEDKQAIYLKAEHALMSASSYLVYCGLHREIIEKKSKLDKSFVVQLGKIGNNFNQLARAANSGEYVTPESLDGIARELEFLRKKSLDL
jgi:hypothetical protein